MDFYSTLARDITERKQLERRLSEEKERAKVTLGSIGDAVIRTDALGVIEYLNPVAAELLGETRRPSSASRSRGRSSWCTRPPASRWRTRWRPPSGSAGWWGAPTSRC